MHKELTTGNNYMKGPSEDSQYETAMYHSKKYTNKTTAVNLKNETLSSRAKSQAQVTIIFQ